MVYRLGVRSRIFPPPRSTDPEKTRLVLTLILSYLFLDWYPMNIFSRRACIAAALTPVFLLSCSPNHHGPSEDTRFLEAEILPDVVDWSKNNKDSLALSEIMEGRGYEGVCLINEYHPLWDIADHAAKGPLQYFSNFGLNVPEGYSALIVVRGVEAHAVLVDHRDVFLGGNWNRPCIFSRGVRLVRRSPLPGFSTPTAGLEITT